MVIVVAAALLGTLAGSGATCEGLKSLTLPNTTVTVAEQVPAGPSTVAVIRSRPLSRSPWSCPVGRFAYRDGSVAAAGELERQVPGGRQWRLGRGHQLRRDGDRSADGYATASTDTGHKGGSGAFAIGHPEKLVDFGYRAMHEMTVQSKAIIAALLQPARRGCRTGTAARPAAARA